MRLGMAIVAALVATVCATGPVEAAATNRVTLRAQVSATGVHNVILTGRVAGRARSVEIESWTNGRWARVRAVRVNSRHRYRAVVPAAVGAHRYRAVAARRHSPARAVLVAPTATSASPSPTAARKPSDACGVRPVKADGTLWSCTFVDDFSGTQLDRSRWTVATRYVTGSSSAFACAVDDPSVVSVSDGSLNLSVRQVADPVPCDIITPGATTPYIAGTVSTAQSFNQKYGRFEARIRNTAASVPGLHEAFWLWPVDQGGVSWPDSGEIDVAETYSVYPNLAIPYLHSSADSGGAVPGFNTAWNCAAQRGEWNTYTLEWTATRIEFLVNGRSCLVNTAADPAFAKAYIPILTQALGQYNDSYDGRAPLPATMNVDYLRVWQ